MAAQIHYIMLETGEIVVEPDLMTWAKAFETHDRKMAWYQIGEVVISTVFLALDHNFGRGGRPVLFETMIFGGAHDQDCWRYCTRDEALAGHKAAVELVGGRVHDHASIGDGHESAGL
jgi:hypothetical protein